MKKILLLIMLFYGCTKDKSCEEKFITDGEALENYRRASFLYNHYKVDQIVRIKNNTMLNGHLGKIIGIKKTVVSCDDNPSNEHVLVVYPEVAVYMSDLKEVGMSLQYLDIQELEEVTEEK